MTTYPTSTAPAAKSWLFGQMQSTLTAATGFTFQLGYATNEGTLDNPDDMVWLGKVANRQVKPFAMVGDQGAFSTAEAYDLEVTVSCYRAGEGYQPGIDAETRAWVLVGVIETIQRTDPTMGGVLWTSRPNASDADVDWDDSGNGRVCTIPLSFHCEAVI